MASALRKFYRKPSPLGPKVTPQAPQPDYKSEESAMRKAAFLADYKRFQEKKLKVAQMQIPQPEMDVNLLRILGSYSVHKGENTNNLEQVIAHRNMVKKLEKTINNIIAAEMQRRAQEQAAAAAEIQRRAQIQAAAAAFLQRRVQIQAAAMQQTVSLPPKKRKRSDSTGQQQPDEVVVVKKRRPSIHGEDDE
jgi:hypothetical protein